MTQFTGEVLGEKRDCSHGGSAHGQMERGCEGHVWHLGPGFATGLGKDGLAKISRVWFGNLVCPFSV